MATVSTALAFSVAARKDLRRGINRILIEPVAKSANDSQDAESSRGSKQDLEHDIAFDACLACLLGVVGTRLEYDFERLGRSLSFGSGLPRRIHCYGGSKCRAGRFGFRSRLWWRHRGRNHAESLRSCDRACAVR